MLTGKIIAIEGVDGSGKETQSNLLAKSLKEMGYEVKKISFPCYESESSALVKMYLNGELGNVREVNAYTASLFYAVDRFASYQTDWKKDLESGKIIVSDRYTTANMIHQGCKIKNPKERKKYLDWLLDLEFCKMNLPSPAVTIFLDVPVELSLKLIKNRSNKINHSDKKDIHELNPHFLEESYENAKIIAKEYHWCVIPCSKNNEMRSIEEIHQEILDKVCTML